MLDAFKIIGGGGKGKAQQVAFDELQALIASAREERGALSEILTQVSLRSTKLTQTQKSLEQVEKKATSSSERLDQLNGRLASLDERTKGMEDVDKRIKHLLEATRQAQQAAEKVVGPEGDLQKHRDAVKQLSSQALETQASLDTLKRERATLEDLRAQLRQTQTDLTQSLESASALKTDLDQFDRWRPSSTRTTSG